MGDEWLTEVWDGSHSSITAHPSMLVTLASCPLPQQLLTA